MHSELTVDLLEALARVPADHAVPASGLEPGKVAQEGLRVGRRLEDLGLVTAVDHRPKTVQVANQPFPRTLQGLLRKKPFYRELVRDSRLLIIGLLSTAPGPMKAPEIGRRLGLHRNTVGSNLRALSKRAILRRTPAGLEVGDHVPDLKTLGVAYMDHLLQRQLACHPKVQPVQRRHERLVVESEATQRGLQATGVYRFQIEGAAVLAARHQYALTPSDGPTSLEDAYRDALALKPPPRTLAAIEKFMSNRRKRSG